MARPARVEPSEIYRCVEAFAIFRGGVPAVYSDGFEVLGSDPILRTHRAHFQPATDQILRRQSVEQATAAPGEMRSITSPPKDEDHAQE